MRWYIIDNGTTKYSNAMKLHAAYVKFLRHINFADATNLQFYFQESPAYQMHTKFSNEILRMKFLWMIS